MIIESPQRATTRVPIHPLLSNRWSPRAFSDAAVGATEIASLFEAARWSPSSRNEQPWHFIYVTRDQEHAFRRMVSVLSELNQRWARRAPLLILATATLSFGRDGRLNRHAFYDVGQAVAHLTVEAESQGLRVHQMGGFDPERARALLGIPEGVEPVVVMAVGYPAPAYVLPDDLRARETAPRNRRSLSESVFNERWGQPENVTSALADILHDGTH